MGAFSDLRGDATLAVYIDLKSPYAFIAIEPTRAMASAMGIAIDWRPFTLDIPSYLGSAKLDRKGKVASSQRTPQQWTGVRYAYYDARRYASLRDKTLRGTVKIWDSSLAGIAMLWVKWQRPDLFDCFVDEIYSRFWRRDLDIEDIGVLESALGGVAPELAAADAFRAYADGPGRQAHDELNRKAFEAGVYGVPTYLAADEMWFGREHLPRVEWLLRGESGPPPGVANRAFGA
jgi:2-hydroxychromene-2-carboxylate isomerase